MGEVFKNWVRSLLVGIAAGGTVALVLYNMLTPSDTVVSYLPDPKTQERLKVAEDETKVSSAILLDLQQRLEALEISTANSEVRAATLADKVEKLAQRPKPKHPPADPPASSHIRLY